jgi:DNA-binding CsgD family transcriptional regulator
MAERTAGQSKDFESWQTTRPNLPVQLTTFIGREREVGAVYALLRRPEIHLLTLTGTGGVGKTRLGLQVAYELLDTFSDGVFFVSLAPITDPDLVVPAIAESLGIREIGSRILMDLLKAYLHDKCLLLLDNFEQVLAASREAIGTLIPPVYRTVYEQAVAAACTQLGERAFAAAWAEGRSMTLEQVLAARGQVTLPAPSRPTVSYPDGLTAREVYVLSLVAQGLTDAQIAEQLIISPRTVNTHLTSIYRKSGSPPGALPPSTPSNVTCSHGTNCASIALTIHSD